jgi:type II restriction enzyme
MKLDMMAPTTLASYKSRSQIARIVSEHWGQTNLYCAACEEDNLIATTNNTRAFDFECPSCAARYQLKSSRNVIRNRIVDSAYSAMRSAIESDRVPNLLALHYSDEWMVRNLMLIPSFCFSVSALEMRKPLSATARRAGWIGCNILLNAMPPDARIPIVSDCRETAPTEVRMRFNNLRGLSNLAPKARGWTLEILRLARSLGQKTFTLSQMYRFEAQLSATYPLNSNIRPKIRQQLQVLRDMGILRFLSPGNYEFIW